MTCEQNELQRIEQELMDVRYVVDGSIGYLHGEIDNLRTFQAAYATADDVSGIADRLYALELVIEGMRESIAAELTDKLKECLKFMPETINKEDFVEAIDSFLFS